MSKKVPANNSTNTLFRALTRANALLIQHTGSVVLGASGRPRHRPTDSTVIVRRHARARHRHGATERDETGVSALTSGPSWLGRRAPSRPRSHADGPRHVAPLAWRAAPLRRSGALGSPRRSPRPRNDRAHTRADAPPVPAVIAHGRLEGVGARLHTCAEHPDTMGGQSTAHWAVWVCMGGCPWRAVAGFSPGDRTISFVEDLEEVGLRRSRTPAEPPQHGSPAGSIERGRSRRSAASAGCADSDMRAEAPRQQHNTSTCFDRRAGGAADDGDRLPARAAGGRCENRE